MPRYNQLQKINSVFVREIISELTRKMMEMYLSSFHEDYCTKYINIENIEKC